MSYPYFAHKFCLLQNTILVYGLTISNFLIAISYFIIPTILSIYNKKQSKFPNYIKIFLPSRLVTIAYITFIFSCGIGHFWKSLTLWYPWYPIELVIDSITAIISIVSMIIIPLGLPGFLHKVNLVVQTVPKLQDVKELLESDNLEVAKHELNIVLSNLKSLTDLANSTKERLEDYGRRE